MKNLKTNELLYLYREGDNKIAFKILIDRFLNVLYFSMINKYNEKFYNLPFENEDFYSMTYEGLSKSIELFNYSQSKYKFEQFCFFKTSDSIFNEVKKYLRLSHRCLNQAFSYSASETTDYGLTKIEELVDDRLLDEIASKNILIEFENVIDSINSKKTKKILRLWMQGFKCNEIAKELELTPLQVSNRLYSFLSDYRKKYYIIYKN
ncbi:MAG: hypothetical protein RR798_00270 [Malacoplasma sp.]